MNNETVTVDTNIWKESLSNLIINSREEVIYLFSLDGKILYIGETSHFIQRMETHISEEGKLHKRLKKSPFYREEQIEDVEVTYFKAPNKHSGEFIEKCLIRQVLPPFNKEATSPSYKQKHQEMWNTTKEILEMIKEKTDIGGTPSDPLTHIEKRERHRKLEREYHWLFKHY